MQRRKNKTLRFGKSQSDVTAKFLAKPAEVNKGTLNSLDNVTLALVCYADAGFGTPRDGSSHGGFIVMVCDRSVHGGSKVPAIPLAILKVLLEVLDGLHAARAVGITRDQNVVDMDHQHTDQQGLPRGLFFRQ